MPLHRSTGSCAHFHCPTQPESSWFLYILDSFSSCQPSSLLLTHLPLPRFPLPTNPFSRPRESALPPSKNLLIWMKILDSLFLLFYPNIFVFVPAACSLRPRFHLDLAKIIHTQFCPRPTGAQPKARGWRSRPPPPSPWVRRSEDGVVGSNDGHNNYIFEENTINKQV